MTAPARYHFLSEFTLRGDADRIWSVLGDIPAWPSWWSWLKRIEILREPTGPEGVGGVYRNTIRVPTGYGLTYDTEVTAVESLRRIDVDSRGDLVGRGRFLLVRRPEDSLELAFIWLIATPKAWMSLLAPVGRPAFGWNHDKLMSAFGTGLARAAGAELTSSRNSAIAPGRPGFHVMPEPVDDRPATSGS